MNAISAENINYTYAFESSHQKALDDISIKVKQGEFVAIVGHNGCGKSTLIKHFNALLEKQSGKLIVNGIDVDDTSQIFKLRRSCGMVFQNPDNQFVSSLVSEDIAFGLENYEVDIDKIPVIIASALHSVGLDGFSERSTNTLSGGQKQRLALAGVLALNPDILIFDEVTSMLDPQGRKDMLGLIKEMNNRGKTVIMVTHYIDEAVYADTLYLMHNARFIAHGTPREMLTDIDLMNETGLLPPTAVRVYNDLKKHSIYLENCPLNEDELVEEICRYRQRT